MQTIKEIINQEVQELESTLTLIKLNEEAEPYVLTAAEEDSAIDHAITQMKKHAAWKMANYGLSEMEILSRIAQTDFNELIDRDKILMLANSNKLVGQWQKSQRDKERKELEKKQQEIRSFWTAKNVLRLMQWTSENEFGKELITNKDTMSLIKVICFFLSEDPRFETELGYSHRKGLLIRGTSGLGKTFVVNCARQNELNPIIIQSMIEITDCIKSDGEFSLNMSGKKVLYLDDVGTEEAPVKYYGTNISWFKDFLELYYSKDKPFRNLMLSTNLSFQQIEDKYGFRVRSRMKDMFNVIDVIGIDMRGSN